MRQIGIVTLGLALVVGVIATACSGGDKSADNGTPSGPVNITFFTRRQHRTATTS